MKARASETTAALPVRPSRESLSGCLLLSEPPIISGHFKSAKVDPKLSSHSCLRVCLRVFLNLANASTTEEKCVIPHNRRGLLLLSTRLRMHVGSRSFSPTSKGVSPKETQAGAKRDITLGSTLPKPRVNGISADLSWRPACRCTAGLWCVRSHC